MTTLFAPTALLPTGWADNVLIETDKEGYIVGLDTFKTLPPGSDAEIINGPLLPGMSNVHSHAFQRAMAGLAERAIGNKDNFWSWRETMYRFLAALTPEDMEALAAQLYVDLLKGGYTTVGEFHYVHNQPDGTPYADISRLSHSIIRAALDAGIAITHMPSLYAYGDCGGAPASEGQKRFIGSVDSVMRIIEEVYAEYRSVPQVSIGFAPHSLRAVSGEMLLESVSAFRRLLPDAPIHIHAAEQMTEVDSCVKWSGQRPVEWLLNNAPVDDKWCLIHSTHVTEEELSRLAKIGAVAGLCPTTEANLGDGIFPLLDYFNAGGTFGIGSDSHITVNMTDELRWLEYIQRLIYQQRTLIRDEALPSVGANLFEKTLLGGARALGRNTGRIEVGCRADFIVLDDSLPFMTGRYRDHLIDSAIFAANKNPIRDVMAGGRWVVKNYRHKREDVILENFKAVMEKLI